MLDPLIEIVDLDEPQQPSHMHRAQSDQPSRLKQWVVSADLPKRIRNLHLPEEAWQVLLFIAQDPRLKTLSWTTKPSEAQWHHWTHELSLMGLIYQRDTIDYPTFLAKLKSTTAQAVDLPLSGKSTPELDSTGTAPPAQRKDTVHTACLSSLSDFVNSRKGIGPLARLTIYRIFSQVPRELFIQEGITSFMFIDDGTEIHSPALREALIQATEKVMGKGARMELENLCGAS